MVMTAWDHSDPPATAVVEIAEWALLAGVIHDDR